MIENSSLQFDSTFPLLKKNIEKYENIINITEYQDYFQKSIQRTQEETYYMMDKFYKEIKQNFLSLVNEEIIRKIPEWEELLNVDESSVAVHTMNVLYLLINSQDFKQLDDFQQNVLKWAVILHDVKKRGPPQFKGKDHIHPFQGGIAVLNLFSNLKLIKQSEIIEMIELINKSQKIIKTEQKSLCNQIQSHKHLRQLFEIFWTFFKRNSFEDLIFRIVFFHQSLPGINEIPPMVQLEQNDIEQFCDKQFLNLLRVFMKFDSFSYQFINNSSGKALKWCCEIDKNIQMIMDQFHDE